MSRPPFEEVWAAIRRHEGDTFRQKTGREFTYVVQGNTVIPSTTNRNLPRSSFLEAYERWPIKGPGEIQQVQGPSYVYAVLADPRIVPLATQAGPTAWTSEERMLALQLYLEHGTSGHNDPRVIELSKLLNRLALHPDSRTRDTFRNPNGVALKLANFAALDPGYAGVGMTRFSKGDEETWRAFAGDKDRLDSAINEFLANHNTRAAAADATGVDRDIESQNAATYMVETRATKRLQERRESALVDEFAAFLRASGQDVGARHYDQFSPPLRNDLADRTERRLWEAKSEVSRSAVRMAIGQVLHYQHLETNEPWKAGVLLPHRPDQDLVNLVHSISAALAYRSPAADPGFVIEQPDDDT